MDFRVRYGREIKASSEVDMEIDLSDSVALSLGRGDYREQGRKGRKG